MKRKLLKLFLWHLLFYLLFYEFRVALDKKSFIELSSWLELKDGLLNLSSCITFTAYALGSYWILFRYYQQSITKVIIGLITIFIIVVSSRYFIEEVLYLHLFSFDNYYDGMSTLSYVLRNLFYAFLHIGFGCIFFFIQYSVFKERQTQALLIENKKTELAYLRSQVNPHFLFNTLNNIYSLVYQKSDKALPALEKLTTILRYSLYEGKDKISLEKEINGIQNFIDLETMRYDYPLDIDFKIEENLTIVMIPPFLLLPFVENAFKHGNMKTPIKIHLKTNNQQLHFNVKNQIQIKQKDKVGGIGLENIQKRLKLIYGDNYDLKIEKSEDDFEVRLMINI